VASKRDEKLRKVLETIIRSSQGNFDHLSGEAREFARRFNRLANDVADLYDILGVERTQDNNEQSGGVTPPNLDLDEHTHENSDEGGTVSHDVLTGVSANDHHNQAHDQGDHDRAEVGDLIAVAAAADAGTSVEVPNADHRHAHGTGYTGAHSDAVNDGDAAGGDLSGTYPNPSVVDDSHSHASSTAPGTDIIVQEQDTTKVSALRTLDFNGTDFNVTDEGSGEARIDLASAGGGTGSKMYAHWLGG